MSEDDIRKEAEIRRQRLRDQIKDLGDDGQRTTVRNWVIELMVDHGMLLERFEEQASKTTSFMANVDSALFAKDGGLVPFTKRVEILLNAGCRAVKVGAGILVTVLTLTSPLWVPVVSGWMKLPIPAQAAEVEPQVQK